MSTTSSSPLPEHIAAEAKRLLAAVQNERGYPAVSIAIASNGSVVWQAARGYADLENRTVATPQSRFAIGSVSKTITAALVARLVDKQMLGLDDDVRSLVPRAKRLTHAVTLRQLLSHQGGIRHYNIGPRYPGFTEFKLNREFPSADSAVSQFIDDDLKFVPDQQFLYSTHGFTLVAAALEQRVGVRFPEILSREIAVPLALRSLEVDDALNRHADRTVDYARARFGRAVSRVPETNSSNKWAGGGMVSTPTDLAMFGSALLDTAFITRSMRDTLFTARRLSSGDVNPQRYALGWRAGTIASKSDSAVRVRIVHHGGTAVGSEAAIVVVPDRSIVVALAGNASTGSSTGLLNVALEIARWLISP